MRTAGGHCRLRGTRASEQADGTVTTASRGSAISLRVAEWGTASREDSGGDGHPRDGAGAGHSGGAAGYDGSVGGKDGGAADAASCPSAGDLNAEPPPVQVAL